MARGTSAVSGAVGPALRQVMRGPPARREAAAVEQAMMGRKSGLAANSVSDGAPAGVRTRRSCWYWSIKTTLQRNQKDALAIL
jgi:hypothetical protein